MVKSSTALSCKTILLSTALFSSLAYADLPFNIVPDGTLPTEVSIGSPVSAAYEVGNNTRYARSGNFVLSLPPNVVLDPSVGSGDCGTTFDLAAKGSSGDSCILNLLVYGAVNGSDPNPSNHLFVCMSDRTTCAGTAYPLNVTVSDGPPPPINQLGVAVGVYTVTASPSNPLPLILNNIHDNSLLWEAVPLDSIEMPTGAVNAETQLIDVACNSENCTAVGSYQDNEPNTLPLILNSDDAGNTSWTGVEAADINLPAATADSDIIALLGVSCLEDVCTATGYYNNAQDNFYPLILNSEDRENWAGVSSSNITMPSNFLSIITDQSSDEGINNTPAVTCTSTYCVFAATYISEDEESVFPLILRSSNGRNNWAYPSKITLPKNALTNTARSRGVTCAGNKCKAVGVYTNTNNNRFPLILNSANAGNSWEGVEPDQIVLPYPVSAADDPRLVSVSCVGVACTAVGGYDQTGNAGILILNSDDGGYNWIGVEEDAIHMPADYDQGAFVVSVVCTSELCTVLGSYNTESALEPLILNSTDGGATWYAVDSDEIELPDDTALAILSGLG